MGIKNMVGMILSVTVSIICIGAVMMPILTDAATVEDTFVNDGLYRMSQYDTDAEITAVWDYTDPYALTVNDDRIELPEQSGSVYLMTIVGATETLLRYGYVSGGYVGVQLFDSSSNSVMLATTTNIAKNMDIAISGGTATFTVEGSTSVSVSYSDYIFMADSDGDYVMKYSTDNVYMNGDSQFYGYGRSTVNTAASTVSATCISVAGTIDDGFTVEGMYLTLSSTNNAIISSEVDNYLDLYSFQGVTFTAVYDNSGTEYETELSYTQIIVPYEVTAERSVHLNSGEIAIITVIPVLMILAVLVSAAYMVIRRD